MKFKQVLACAAALVAITSSFAQSANSLVGTWKVDLNTIKMDFGAHAKDPKFSQQMQQMMPKIKQSFAQATLWFQQGGRYKGTNPGGQTTTGKYAVSGSTVKLTPDKKQSQPEPDLHIINGRTLAFHMAQQGMTVDFHLVKKA